MLLCALEVRQLNDDAPQGNRVLVGSALPVPVIPGSNENPESPGLCRHLFYKAIWIPAAAGNDG